jgi:predicted nucleic acid-binding protein
MRILLDTNILTRSAQPHHVQHQAAITAIATLRDRRDVLCLAPQNLYEFWVVSTRPLGENGLGMTIAQARARLDELEQSFTILDETPVFRREWTALVVQHHVAGKAGHDARLVAAMKVYALTAILTFNMSHFVRYQGITVLAPEDVVQPTR